MTYVAISMLSIINENNILPLKSNAPRVSRASLINSGFLPVPKFCVALISRVREVILPCASVAGAPSGLYCCPLKITDRRSRRRSMNTFSTYSPQPKYEPTLNSSKEWWNVLCDGCKCNPQRLAQSTRKHQIKLIVQELRQIGPNR